MEQKNYCTTITTDITADDAYQKIADVGNWWSKSFKGSALNTGDAFTVQFGDTRVAFEITEAVPSKRIVWKVTDCYLHWLENKTEWNDTEVVWEIKNVNNATQIEMTHIGLMPGIECFENCRQGWNRYIKGSLLQLVTEGKGLPD